MCLPLRLLLGIGCLAVAALTLLRPWAPTTDPWGWIVWGREIMGFGLDTDAGTPAWKPFPVLVTAPLALAGSAAPMLWLLVARAGGLAALVIAYRLGSRLGGRAAGVVAAAALCLSDGFLRALEHGYSEPLLSALLLGAFALHLAGRRGGAVALGSLVALGRPEAWPLLVVYAALSVRGHALRPALALPALAAVPLLWLGGDWLGSGNALHARGVASAASRESGPGDVLSWAVTSPGWVVTAAAIAALPIAARATGDGRVRHLGVLAGSWLAVLCGLVAFGYPASERFVALPVALLCVLAGVGLAGAWRLTAPRRPARLALAAGLVLAVLLLGPARVGSIPGQVRAAEARAQMQTGLRTVVRSAYGAEGFACGPAVVPVALAWNGGAVAWDLEGAVDTVDTAVPWERGDAILPAAVLLSLARTGSDGRSGVRTYQVRPEGGATVFLPYRVARARAVQGYGAGLPAPLIVRRRAGPGPWSAVSLCPRA